MNQTIFKVKFNDFGLVGRLLPWTEDSEEFRSEKEAKDAAIWYANKGYRVKIQRIVFDPIERQRIAESRIEGP